MVIPGGASGYLRQEFRELELLNEITKLKYTRQLHSDINGHHHNTIIHQFQKWKGTSYILANVHSAIKWSKYDGFDMSEVTDSPWQIVKKEGETKVQYKSKKSDTLNFVPAQGSAPLMLKHKLEDDVTVASNTSDLKRRKISTHQTNDTESPLGLLWDSENNSCAYDALLTILLSIWSQNPSTWKTRFKDMNRIMNVLITGFYSASNDQGTLESARNKVRHLLHQRNPVLFPY